MAMIAQNIGAAAEMRGTESLFNRVANAWARRKVYKQTYAELNSLSTRELDDLGISRSMISRLAYEAAYKN